MSNNMNATTGNIFIPEVWSKELIIATEAALVLAPRLWDMSEAVSEYGDTINIPNISNLEAEDKLANVDVQLQAPTETNTVLLIDTHKASAFVVEDKLSRQSKYNLLNIYKDESAKAIGRSVEKSIAALASAFSQEKGTYNTAITTDVILDAIELLDEADVPMTERYFAFRPDVKRDLLDLATYTSSDFVGSDKPVRTGTVGDLYGVETIMTTNLVKSGNNTNNMLFHRQAIAIAWQQKARMQMEYSLMKLGTVCVADALWGLKETRDDHGVLIKT